MKKLNKLVEQLNEEQGDMADLGENPKPPAVEEEMGDEEEALPDSVEADICNDLAAAIMDAFKETKDLIDGSDSMDAEDAAVEAQDAPSEPGEDGPPPAEGASQEGSATDDAPPGDDDAPASAEEAGDPLEQAQQKVESLEAENAELRKRLAAATSDEGPDKPEESAPDDEDMPASMCEEDDMLGEPEVKKEVSEEGDDKKDDEDDTPPMYED